MLLRYRNTLTEQYGQVDRVSVVRAIFSSRICASPGVRSNPRTDRAIPPVVALRMNSRRLVAMPATDWTHIRHRSMFYRCLIGVNRWPYQPTRSPVTHDVPE